MKGSVGFLVQFWQGCLALLLAVAGVAVLLGAPQASAASFDCSKAAAPYETTICADETLSQLDWHLGAYLTAARQALGDGGACLVEDQKQWVAEVRQPCGDNGDCLRHVYLERLAALDGLQPDGGRVTEVKLPDSAVLVTALPPEAEANGQPTGGPFAVTGQLVPATRDGKQTGVAVRSLVGRTTVIAHHADEGTSPAHALLHAALRQAGDATYRVQGSMNPANAGLALNKCRFVYRVPE